ncbi:thyrotroph embryonic factor isoform X1 [Coregonus clupeaformis]|uniref:thyrotroph embryonic factor isoform X1 n=1 Tax=Coregonus clupeaformis TaxID=59861 RepID=UPI001BDF7A54|nr:thyrotroph embryonic factor isoform X1 [Coregonus clupeaformis]
MDIPPPNILEGDDEIEKKKLCSADNSEAGVGGGSGGTGGTGVGGVSASLTPAIWEKTIPYDGETFHLEYMDLDEFLQENGIPVTLEEELQKSLAQEETKGTRPPTATVTSDTETVTLTLEPAEQEKEEEDGEEEDAVSGFEAAEGEVSKNKKEGKSADRLTPTPIDPEDIEVDINFQPDPTDLVLSSVPGGELFNPRKHKFSDEDLKPQPMIKKAKKVFVPTEQKDDKYWSRRKKNNVAAKRSRDARRLKENQITVRASFLERENAVLRQQVAELRKDCGRCKNIMSRYEAKYGPL